jgi:transcriptional regulator with GAF, ATPase, and Fis domain
MRPDAMITDASEALAALRAATVAFANAEADSDATLRLALGHLIAVTGADAGAVAVPGEDGRPEVLAERFLGQAGPLSMTALQRALEAQDEEPTVSEPPASASVLQAAISSILCTPVRRRGRTLAAVYLDRRGKPPFDATARDLAVNFAATLALALDLTRRVERIEGQAAEARAEAAHAAGYWSFGSLTTRSHAFARCLQLAERAAGTDTLLLLLGETGSGKEHLARCVHATSPRSRGPFLPINCAAVPEALLESELFGHERGAYTGAVEMRRGQFELAEGGTLFLDEVGDLPPSVQPKLLRVLEDRTVTRVGGSSPRRVDVRIVAATHKDLRAEVEHGRFREDLYYRLDVLRLHIPPLRERPEDIPALAEAFLARECERRGPRLRWSEAALRRLAQHGWPGNVRELKNAVEKLCILAEGPVLDAADVEERLFHGPGAAGRPGAAGGSVGLRERLEQAEVRIATLAQAVGQMQGAPRTKGAAAPAAMLPTEQPSAAGPKPGRRGDYRERMAEAERQVLLEALEEAGSVAAAARMLRISRQSLTQKCKRLGIQRSPDFEIRDGQS